MQVARGLGHLPDGPEAAYVPLRFLVGAVATPTEVDLTPWVGDVLDQGATNACVGYAFAKALSIRGRLTGHEITPSHDAIYALARQLADPTATELPDTGCQPYLAVKAMREVGLVDAERWRMPAREPVPFDVLRAGADAVLTGCYGITTGGTDRLALIRQSVTAGFPVTFAMPVDRSYEAGKFGQFLALAGPSVGSHCQTIVGFYDTRRAVRVLNSWGEGWCQGGYAWLDYDWIQSPSLFDFNVITAAPAAVR